MSKGQTSAVIGIVLSAVIALLAVFGYNVAVVQPQLEALEMQIVAPAGGTTNFDDLSVDSVTATDLTVTYDATTPLTITGVLTDVILLFEQQ